MKWLRILSLKFYHKLLGIMNVRELTQNELNRISQAFVFAFSAHSGTSRGDGVPYVIHPIRVSFHAQSLGMSVEAIIAAVLHDVVEDTDIKIEEIGETFGSKVSRIVAALTKPERGTPDRNQIYQQQLLDGPEEAKRIKLLDIQDNLSDIDEFLGPKKGAEYRKSREYLLELLSAALDD